MKRLTRVLPVLAAILLAATLAQAAFKLPAPEKLTLNNGITVFFLKTVEVPLVSFRLYLKGAGSAQNPPNSRASPALRPIKS